jgi:hypothetical protein
VTTIALPGTLSEALARFGSSAFLLSVTAECRPHIAPVEVEVEEPAGARLAVAVLRGARSARNAAANSVVCLHWPPVATSDGYSLIVDGDAITDEREHDTVLRIRPVKAVLHRPGAAEPGTNACGHDCVGITLAG